MTSVKFYTESIYDNECKRCGEHNDYQWGWCKSCQINDFKKNFTNWTSGNEKIDSLIQKKQFEINKSFDIIIEWISYDQFDDIKELGKDEFSTIYSAIWKDGPLIYDDNKHEYSREQSMKVNFKLYKSQNINGFLNEVLFCCIGYFGRMEDLKLM
ncbi:unnamed protein product [Rhizophagus irregularis]|nr:unnamed protein product [Rhizophagus irregularis]